MWMMDETFRVATALAAVVVEMPMSALGRRVEGRQPQGLSLRETFSSFIN